MAVKLYLPSNAFINSDTRLIYNSEKGHLQPANRTTCCFHRIKISKQEKDKENQLAWEIAQNSLSKQFKLSKDEIAKIANDMIPRTQKLTFHSFTTMSQKAEEKFLEKQQNPKVEFTVDTRNISRHETARFFDPRILHLASNNPMLTLLQMQKLPNRIQQESSELLDSESEQQDEKQQDSKRNTFTFRVPSSIERTSKLLANLKKEEK